MEDSWEIVVYGALVVLSLVGSIVKKNKAKAEKSAGKPAWDWAEETQESEKEDTVFGRGWGSPAPEPVAMPLPEPAIPTPARHAMHREESYAEGGRSTKDAAVLSGRLSVPQTSIKYQEESYAEGGRSTKDAGHTQRQHIKNQQLEHPEIQDDILPGFDLRKAVIYSEILKPKFTEF